MKRITKRDEFGNADIDGMDMSFTLGLKYDDMVRLTNALNRLADYEDADVNQWIPCSERLPKYGEKVLTYDGYTCRVETRVPFILDEKGEELMSEWWVSDDVDHEKGHYPDLRDGAAIAWMPLPEPYRGD